MEEPIQIFSCGGTIDKVYFDKKSDYQVGEPQIGEILRLAKVTFSYQIQSLLRKDSLEINDEDRMMIRRAVEQSQATRLLITHGTDHMPDTAKALKGIPGKTIVLTGANSPALFVGSDAQFNIGCALGALQCLSEGVYIVMNGRVFLGDRVKKNRQQSRFDWIDG